MRRDFFSRLLAFALYIFLCFGCFSVTAFAESEYHFEIVSNIGWAGDSSDTTLPHYSTPDIKDNQIDHSIVQGITIDNYNNLASLKLNYVELDGLIIPFSEFEKYTRMTEIDTSSCVNLNGRVTKIRVNNLGQPQIMFESDQHMPNADITIRFVFEDITNYSARPLVSSSDDRISISDNALKPVQNTEYGTIWEVSTTCAAGYELRYIQIGEDESTRVYSENGYTIRWEVKDDGAEYYAFGGPVRPHLGNITFPVLDLGVSEGQRLEFSCTCSWGSPFSAVLHVFVYEGNDTTGSCLGYGQSTVGSSGPASSNQHIFIETVPSELNQVTLAARFGDDGELTTKTYEVTGLNIRKSGKTELSWLSPPRSDTAYPTEASVAIQGPNVYDCIAFTDEETGELTLYLGVSGGVMKYMEGIGTSLSWTEGMEFAYNDNESNSGYALALGGKNEENLTALVKETEGDFYSGLSISYCLYTYNNDCWGRVENSDLPSGLIDGQVLTYEYGIVLDRDNVWVNNLHWDGTAWLDNDIRFNSFWKESSNTAYAGSDNGIYKYEDEVWNIVPGTYGTTYVVNGLQNADGSVSLITCETYTTERASQWSVMGGTIKKVDIEGNPVEATQINTANLAYVGLSADGNLYGIKANRYYSTSQFGGYDGSDLYKYENGHWVYQIVDEFFDDMDLSNLAAGKVFGQADENGDLTPKYRPDGIRRILNPTPGVSVFAGQGGGNYILFGTSTISFETNGGSAVEPITQRIGSSVAVPSSPEREGFTFIGWYTRTNFLQNGESYTWGTMPAKDITLYAKWVEGESGEDAFAVERNRARDSLNAAYTRLDLTDYDGDTSSAITAAYEGGLEDILEATTYNGIYAALNAALDVINSLSKNTSATITVAVTVEKFTIDGEYIIEPTLVTIKKYEQASVVLTDVLKAAFSDTYDGKPYTLTGTETFSFYLSGVYTGEGGFLSEFDGGPQSGWMYCINGKFPGVGASSYTLLNQDVMRWQYSCVGLGKDIGADNSAWGVTDSVQVADKDALIWKVAEINRDGNQADYGSAYSDALVVLKDIPASQESVDAALAALSGGGSEEPTSPIMSIQLPDGTELTEIEVTKDGYMLWGNTACDLYTVSIPADADEIHVYLASSDNYHMYYSDENEDLAQDGMAYVYADENGDGTLDICGFSREGASEYFAITFVRAGGGNNTVPEEKIEISEASGTPIATVTSTVESGTATLHVTAANPCVVVVAKADGTYERLEAISDGNGGYDFSKSGYTSDMEFHVLLKGDANGDGVFNGSDITKAKAAYLNKTTLDALGALAADLDGNGLNGSDITKAKAAYLGKTNLDW